MRKKRKYIFKKIKEIILFSIIFNLLFVNSNGYTKIIEKRKNIYYFSSVFNNLKKEIYSNTIIENKYKSFLILIKKKIESENNNLNTNDLINIDNETKNVFQNLFFKQSLKEDEIKWSNIRKNYNNNYSKGKDYISDIYNKTDIKENNNSEDNVFNSFFLVKKNFSNKELLIENIKSNILNKFNLELNNTMELFIHRIFEKLKLNGKSLIKINLNENLNLNNSELDLFLPFIEGEDYVLFIQNNIHKTDNRNQNNLGFGLRKLSSDNKYLLGINSFWDYDISLENTRISLGLEIWGEFFKVSTNAYFGLSRWWYQDKSFLYVKKNNDLYDKINDDEFFSKPATGWDINAEGYFAKLPEIIFKLSYTKYYGNIGFKQSNFLEKHEKLFSPSIYSFSINYTPIPILSFVIENIKTNYGKSNIQFGGYLNFKLNSPISDQIHNKVRNIFSSSYDNRYDFVKRDNNIVLEYRRKFLVKLSTKKEISGFPKSEHPLEIIVNSVNKIININFYSQDNFFKHGGSIKHINNNYTVKLPSYDFQEKKNNSYKIKVVAYDILGNTDINYIKINVVYPLIDKNNSNFSIFPNAILVNSERAKITFEARDINNEPITNIKDISFIVDQGNFPSTYNIEISKVHENPKGTYTALIKGLSSGTALIRVKINNVINKEISNTIDINSIYTDNMQVITNPPHLYMKVSESVEFFIKVFDKHGKGIKSSEIKIAKIVAMDKLGSVRKDSGDFHFEDLTNNKSYDGDNFASYTNKNGELKVKVSDPHGIGVRTFLKVSADDYVSKEVAIIFTVPTSPSNIYARMYGHMPDVISVNGLNFYRPSLFAERIGDRVNHYLNEDWSKFTLYNAKSFCESRNLRLPTKEELLDFYHVHSGNDLLSNYGWPIVDQFNEVWTSSSIRNMYFPDPLYFYVDFLNDKVNKETVNDPLAVFCVQDQN